MPDAYEIHDGVFLTRESNGSGADALAIGISATPAGRVRTILAAYASCSATETQDYWFSINSMGVYWPITMPASRTITLASSRWVPMLLEGMELKLFPNEILTAHRAAATAGSSISLYARYIETDMQYYVELDKQKVLRRREQAMADSTPRFLRRGGLGGRSAFDRSGRDRESGREG